MRTLELIVKQSVIFPKESVSIYFPTFVRQFIFVSAPRIFCSYFGGFTREEKHLKCFLEITSQFLCILLSLPTGPINLGEISPPPPRCLEWFAHIDIFFQLILDSVLSGLLKFGTEVLGRLILNEFIQFSPSVAF